MKYRLHYRQHHFELASGSEFVIGRSSDCQLALDDPLVSRRHAALATRLGRVFVRDLGSRNGVLLNGDDVRGEVEVRTEDVIRIGGQELTLRQAHESQSSTVRQAVPTERSEAFGLLGGLADKALALGRADEAERLLTTHLEGVLDDVDKGRRVTKQTAEQAALYAARLAEATKAGRWFNYVFEVFSKLDRPCPAAVVDELYAGVRKVDRVNIGLLGAYLQQLQARVDQLGPADRFALKRLESLAKQARLR